MTNQKAKAKAKAKIDTKTKRKGKIKIKEGLMFLYDFFGGKINKESL